ncbi:bleomycin resistance protein [Pseudomonas sp. BN415]|uniref:VOC family protein n=1 Tax=Pseudomonas sp. BN415 TaxID=2567889 RepID=UPI0024549C04|nr:VOC family protein [Pseudomonas sp. BN415]MDH4580747.1 bleomycin resistance protein [Pseudomonas sp. BN415]
MSSFTISGTHHTSFTVSNLERTLTFFREGLGLSHSQPSPRCLVHIAGITGVEGADVRVAFVKCPGGHEIELFEYVGPSERSAVLPRPCDVGFAHICFLVDNVDAAVKRAAQFGVKPAGIISNPQSGPAPGARSVYLRDPDGITLELVQLPENFVSRMD